MKKLLSLLLSVVMVLSLTVPAFADTPTVLPMPKDALPPIISVDEAVSLGVIGGADGPTSIFTTAGLEGLDLDLTVEELLQQAISAQKQVIDDQKEALGGVAGQVGVIVINKVASKYVRFPDAAPEITGGRTMVPVRALVETLGGEVDYQDDVVTFAIDGREFEFVIGSTDVTVSDGKPIEMDCAPYIKGGRTYVPIRFISEALGYDVGWDSAYQTAVLLDREKLAADIDKDFSILNRVQAAANPALKDGESWSADMKGDLGLTIFDTVNGNQTYEADLDCKVLLNDKAFDGTCSVTFSDSTIDALMELMIGAGFGNEADENIQLIRTVLTGLKDMQVVMTREGMAWFHAPILDELGKQENAWFAADFGAELGALMFSGLDSSATIGSALVTMLSGNSVAELAALDQLTWFMDRLYGDGSFTTSGGVSTLTIGVDELMGIYKEMGLFDGLDESEFRDIWKEYNITMKVDSKGGVTMTGVMETKAQAGVPTIKMTADAAQDGQNASVTMNVHVANLFQLELKLTTGQKTTSEAPRTEPPKGANIVDMAAPATK